MRYLPHTDEEIADMLETIGADGLDDLFAAVPEACRVDHPPDIPGPLTEWDLRIQLDQISGRMGVGAPYGTYLGGGRYDHYIPAFIPALLSRSEFTTAYTPYQAEISQGTLQGIYEFQTLISRFLGMEVANASLYDGASALAEGLLMAHRITRGTRVALSGVIHPHYRQVVRSYLRPAGVEMMELPWQADGRTDPDGLNQMGDLAAVAIQSPNFFGSIEDLKLISAICSEKKALLVTCFTEPLAYGLLKSPGSQGAHVACGEGQSLGIPMGYGGPGLGLFATRRDYVRQMPGRLVGKTSDTQGKQGFVLTLATREQHIRREKATSNICTNSSLCALNAAMYMAALGGPGIRELAQLNHDKAAYLKAGLREMGCSIPFDAPTFNEFVVAFPGAGEEVYGRLLEKRVAAGLPLAPYAPDLGGHYLMCVTETKSKSDMDQLIAQVAETV
ncbi:MAG: aminomethyl-transferring glycine dehydrogenase subunit GcvPA [Desulfobacteraceae bacterium]